MDIGQLALVGGPYTAAIIAAGFAWRANGIAKKANEHADAANQLSSESNTIAREANDLAGGANEVAKKALDHQTENHDVRWVLKWPFDGVLHLVNDGQDTPYSIVAVIKTGLREYRLTEDEVSGPDGYIEIDMQREYQQQYDLRAEHKRRYERKPPPTPSSNRFIQTPQVATAHFEPPYMASGWLDMRVTWKTALGRQCEQILNGGRFLDFAAD